MDIQRRKTLNSIMQTMGLVALGGFIWSAFISEAKSNPLWLYPPGARDDFVNSCIRCGLCVEACPFYTLRLSKEGTKGLPIFVPREIPCFMCEDIPCASACPTDALDINLVSTNNSLDITKARMGVAVVDTLNCIAYAGIQCDACYRACPLIDEAIYLEYKANERTGCGKCEKACITELASIRVLPRDIVLGKMGTHYIKGWEEQDENRLDSLLPKQPKSESKKQMLDYLNSENL